MTLRIISLGAGVQSTAVLMLALAGELGEVDAAIFADTGWEPRAVYQHLDRLDDLAAGSLPIHRVSNGNIRDTTAAFPAAPFFVVNQNGKPGMARRQCTNQHKIRPIRWKLRELMRETGAQSVDLLMGISVDEVTRMRTSDVAYITNRYPLVERAWRRSDCVAYLARLGLDAPRSACIGCPYRTNAEWRALEADEFADAVAFEREVQTRGLHRGDATPYLHAARVPLADVDLSTPEDHGQISIDDECAGLCWT